MKTISYYIIITILSALLLLQLMLVIIPEPVRVTLWYLLQAVLPILGGLSLICAIIYLVRKSRWHSKKPWVLGVIGIVAIVFPFVPVVLEWPYPARLENAEKSAFVRVPL
jgi:membrane protease YdiL (CAAX protease family)